MTHGSTSSQEPPGPRRVIVVGMDTVRSDHMGFLGHTGGLTPALDAVARDAIVFERAWAPAPRTRPSFRSATTGRWPIPDGDAPTLAALLGAHGFQTAGFVANVQLSEELGFAEGFDTWVLDNMATADAQVDAALGWLRERPGEDVFLSLHPWIRTSSTRRRNPSRTALPMQSIGRGCRIDTTE